MRTLRIGTLTALSGWLLAITLGAQPLRRTTAHAAMPAVPGHSRSATARFLASEEGRSLLAVSGHPLSRYLNQAFGEPSAEALAAARARWHPQKPAAAESEATPAVTPCTGNSGARFNLEPRAGAVPQQNAAADFILNGVGQGEDLIVQSANDWRGAFASATWDNSLSGYYVHRAATADCSVQFEGGLPSITYQGGAVLGVGDAAVVADPTRRAFFMADMRFGSTAGIGLFRASAANLLNPANCPAGTHRETQAASCWTETPPVLVNPVTQPYFNSEFNLAVDERASGTGAGDLYIAANTYITSADADYVVLMACTNATLSCSPMVTLSTSGTLPDVHVRQDGMITVSYLGFAENGAAEPVGFVTCTPAGAPNPPVCGTPTTVTTNRRYRQLCDEHLSQACQPARIQRQLHHVPGLRRLPRPLHTAPAAYSATDPVSRRGSQHDFFKRQRPNMVDAALCGHSRRPPLLPVDRGGQVHRNRERGLLHHRGQPVPP